jgi:two-component system chemotaxis response regulator CheB
MRMADRSLTRRTFLHSAGRVVTAVAAAPSFVRAAAPTSQPTPASAPSTRPASMPATAPAPAGSTVVQVDCPDLLRGSRVRPDMLREMLLQGLRPLTRADRLDEAWREILRPDDVIGIKFNRTGADELATTPVFARTLVDTLTDAGWDPKRIVLIEADRALVEGLGTQPARPGYAEAVVDFHSGRDRFAAVLDDITALINVPFLKTHNIAGMTGCLKNLSHGLIRSPARFHANRCSPFIADIIAAEPIRSKLRLNLINAVRAVFDGGPAAEPTNVFEPRALIASRDPVAADTVGVEVLNDERHERGLPVIDSEDIPVPALHDAHKRGVGTTSWDDLRHVRVVVPAAAMATRRDPLPAGSRPPPASTLPESGRPVLSGEGGVCRARPPGARRLGGIAAPRTSDPTHAPIEPMIQTTGGVHAANPYDPTAPPHVATTTEPGMVRVVVANRSPLGRRWLKDLIANDPELSIAAEAATADEGISLARRHRPAVLVIEADLLLSAGIEAVQSLMAAPGLSIVALYNPARPPDELYALEGLDPKHLRVLAARRVEEDAELWRTNLRNTLRIASGRSVIRHIRGRSKEPASSHDAGPPPPAAPRGSCVAPELVAIGASTGAPQALARIFSALPPLSVPVLVVLHFPRTMFDHLLDWMTSLAPMPVVAARHGATVESLRGLIVVAVPGLHLRVVGGRLQLWDGPRRNYVRPSVDELFDSIAPTLGHRTLAVLLTGMGRDGADGLLRIRQAGGRTIAQDAATSAVFGMPKVAIELGAAEHVLPDTAIADAITHLCLPVPA